MNRFLIAGTVIAALAISACGKKKDGFFLPLALSAVNQNGGNQGLPNSGTNQDPAPTDGSPGLQDILNQQPTTQDGTSSSPDIYVEAGVIVGNLDNGSLTTGSGTEVIVVKDGALTGGLQVTIVTQGGTVVSGTTTIVGDDFIFIPSEELDSGQVYAVVITDAAGNTHTENVFLAVDNTCNAQSLFKQATVLSGGNNTVNLKDHVIVDNNGIKKSIVGWDFSSGFFKLKVDNKTAGAKYVLTAYGVYGITGHTCEVYFQRWKSNQKPVENFDITGYGWISVDHTDSSIPNPSGGHYNFSKTYIQLNVYDSAGNDITATDTATVSLNWYANSASASKAAAGALHRMQYAAPYKRPQSFLMAFAGGAGAFSMALYVAIALLGLGGLVVIVLVSRRRQSRGA